MQALYTILAPKEKRMKQMYMIFLSCICLTQGFSQKRGGFEIYGDVMQVLPLAMMAYSYSLGDMQGVRWQAIAAGTTLASSHIIKQSFVVLAQRSESQARISQRPNNGRFDGFPSGHTSWAFSSVGFALKRYGWKVALPVGILATSVGVSRIHAQKHTTLQVLSGAALGFGISYFLSPAWVKNISLWVDFREGKYTYCMAYRGNF
ncbi:phosphatase PAP2 family protein [Helicobacter marmotae]|uniref:Phosphatase PAP2 family protein n=2 Tax=Helicobacter marmotae TaxID=152490 RepID=A0A3D8I2F2_9HELI|nr:phosphatase PAP2 family protein [Helicobacter marmotae]